jgi:hypothetical protein
MRRSLARLQAHLEVGGCFHDHTRDSNDPVNQSDISPRLIDVGADGPDNG